VSDTDETLPASEALDEDELSVDPLEAGIDPPERWSAVDRHGTTAGEVRDGEPLARRLAEEEPDLAPEPGPDRPLAVTPADELDESVEDAPADVEPVAPEDVARPRTADSDPGERADYAGGSVADAIRQARRS